MSPGNVGFCDAQHIHGGLVETDEHAVVDLPQSEQLQHFAHLYARFTVNTLLIQPTESVLTRKLNTSSICNARNTIMFILSHMHIE